MTDNDEFFFTELVKIRKEFLLRMKLPEHNKYGDEGNLIMEILSKPLSIYLEAEQLSTNTFLFKDPEKFIIQLNHSKLTNPIFKIVIPSLKAREIGSIYYIGQTYSSVYIFRGTFGYAGTGPHQSALVEACISYMGYNIEIRNGDYLLSFIR